MLYAGVGAGALLFLIILFKLMWRVAEPNEAPIISGLKTDRPSSRSSA